MNGSLASAALFSARRQGAAMTANELRNQTRTDVSVPYAPRADASSATPLAQPGPAVPAQLVARARGGFDDREAPQRRSRRQSPRAQPLAIGAHPDRTKIMLCRLLKCDHPFARVIGQAVADVPSAARSEFVAAVPGLVPEEQVDRSRRPARSRLPPASLTRRPPERVSRTP
jgi:hypothetical protein